MAKKSRKKGKRGATAQETRARGQESGARRQETGASGQELAESDGELLALLTDREREVLRLYVQVLNAKEVGKQLGTRAQTVRNQLTSIEHKVGAEGREALIAFVLRHGL